MGGFEEGAEEGGGFARVGVVDTLVGAHDGAGTSVNGVVERPGVEFVQSAVGNV